MADLPALADQVLHLQIADKLRLAAGLLERGKPTVARAVAQRAVDEIDLALLLGPPKPERRG